MAQTGITDVPRAVAAAMAVGMGLGLAADEAVVLHASNRVAVRLLPADLLARVALASHGAAQFEVDLAQRLARSGSPVGTLDSRVAPRVYERDGFAVTFWTFFEARPTRDLVPADYAAALGRLHRGMRRIDLTTPHFTDRVNEAARLVRGVERTSDFTEADRELLTNTLRDVTRTILGRRAPEQLLHGEPHPGNVLNTNHGPLFVDLETCCRGPVEFDLANVPEEVSTHYPDVDRESLRVCRVLVFAMVAAWRLDPGDMLPSGEEAARDLLAALRAGPPYPPLGSITGLE